MPVPCKYYWKDANGKLHTSMGIELTDEEKYQLAKKNNELLRKQRQEKAENELLENS